MKFPTNKKNLKQKQKFDVCLCQVTFFNSSLLTDVNECSDGNHVCDVNSNCNNTDGSHICTCKEGYTGDGQSCQGE